MNKLFMDSQKIIVPPIKIQGIKTKLVKFISKTCNFKDKGIWIEPFMGSCVVALNIKPKNAILCDINPHLINFFKAIQNGTITPQKTRVFLEFHGGKLNKFGEKYYLKMRDEFNKNKDPLYFLFLNRSCFNGMVRFNSSKKFNVPFCKKNSRFSKSYITKICNQIKNVKEIIDNSNWKFINCDWRLAFDFAKKNDFIYLDPPYIGRETTYFGQWTMDDAKELAIYSHKSKSSIALSMWKENKFRKNNYLFDYWSDFTWYEIKHYYHVGGKIINRNEMIEILAIKIR